MNEAQGLEAAVAAAAVDRLVVGVEEAGGLEVAAEGAADGTLEEGDGGVGGDFNGGCTGGGGDVKGARGLVGEIGRK